MELIAELEPTPRGVYCGAVGLVGSAVGAGPGPLQRGDPHRGGRPDHRRRGLRHRRRHHLGLGRRGRARRAAGQGRRPRRRRRAPEVAELLETLRCGPAVSCATVTGTSRRLAELGRAARLPFDRRGRPGAAVRAGRRPAVPGAAAARPRRRAGRSSVGAAPAPGGRARCGWALDDEPVDAADPWLYHKTSRRDALRPPSAAASRRRRRRPGQRARRADRGHHGEPRGALRRPVVDPAAGRRPACPASSAAGCWRPAGCAERVLPRPTSRRPRRSPWSARCAAGGPRWSSTRS